MPQQACSRGNADDENDGSRREQKPRKRNRDFHRLCSAVNVPARLGGRGAAPIQSPPEKAQFGSIAMKSLETLSLSAVVAPLLVQTEACSKQDYGAAEYCHTGFINWPLRAGAGDVGG